MRGKRWGVLVAAVGLLLAEGCGRSDRPPLGRVTGTIRYNGQPIASGSVVFEVSGTRPAHGTIVDGKLVDVTTYDQGDGVPVGEARLAVFATAPGGATPAAPATPAADPGARVVIDQNYMGGGARSLIPVKFNDPASSGLTWNIQKGQNAVDLDLRD